MAIPDDVWDDLIDMVPGQLKNRGPLATRWASEDLIDELIEVGHLKVDGGRLTRTRASADAARLWEVLPEDGSALGNLRARTELGWKSTRRYETAKRLLLATEEIAVGRGRGGSVRRISGAASPTTAERANPSEATANRDGTGVSEKITEDEMVVAETPPKMPRPKKVRSAKTLEATLWDAADELRGKMDSAQYKHVVLGLIFLKYVSDTFMVRHNELVRLVNDPDSDYFMPNDAAKKSVLEDRDEYTAEGVFWISEGYRWDDLRKAAKQPDIGRRVDQAMERLSSGRTRCCAACCQRTTPSANCPPRRSAV